MNSQQEQILKARIAELEKGLSGKTLELQQKNRELEIEGALERVRTVAMAMKDPADMLGICRIIADQLALLEVKEIRNVQTAIFYETKGVYINYEFYVKHDKTLITEVDYSTHTVQSTFADRMMKGPNEFFTQGFTGKEVQDWYAYQKTTNVFLDSYLEHASSLTYYWYSLGPVALGMSTYMPLSEEQVTLFQRFRNVFGLAYRRYLDIEQAEAQAREAKIEAALERVRARAMSMHTSEELKDVVKELRKQIGLLGQGELNTCVIQLYDESPQYIQSWVSQQSENNKEITEFNGTVPKKGLLIIEESLQAYLSGRKDYTLLNEKNKLKQWTGFLKETYPDAYAMIVESYYGLKPDEVPVYWSFSDFTGGSLLMVTLAPPGDVSKILLRRFANVFGLAYRRFADLKQAEAQAREAEIELGLERVRARAMAMHKSDELLEVGALLYNELTKLGIEKLSSGYMLADEDKNIGWNYGINPANGNIMPQPVGVPFTETNVMRSIFASWKKQEPLHVIELNPEETIKHQVYMAENAINFPISKEQLLAISPERLVIHTFNFKHGYLVVVGGELLTAQQRDIVVRFAKVFEMTYRRFLDLKQAEAQAREAQVEAALERVRSRTMAMQRSEDLFEVIREVNTQLLQLNFRFDSADFMTDYSDKGYNIWLASTQESFTTPIYITASDTKIPQLLKEVKERGDDFFTFQLNREEKDKYFKHVFEDSIAKNASEEAKQYVYNANGMAVSCFVVKNIILSVANFASIPYTDAENDTIKRFAYVFEQSYTRFLDLQKAEAQAREAKIEAALERVRSRSMGMQKSEELREVIQVIYDQLVQLNFNISNAGFLVDYRESHDGNIWMADAATEFPTKQYIPWFDHPFNDDYLEQRDKGPELFTKVYPFEEKNTWWEFVLKYLPGVSEETRKDLLDLPALALSRVLLKNIGLYLLNYNGTPYTDAENATLIRFAKVFEQTYTRFLDLQKAEAQAREAQIEAALERVRSRSLAMHKSDELQDVVHTVLERLKELNVDFYTVIIVIFQQDSKDIFWWLENKEQQQYPKILLPYLDNPYLRDLFEAKDNGKELFSKCYSFGEKNELFRYLFSDTDFKHVPENQKKFLLDSEFATISVAVEKKTGLHITSYSRNSFSEQEHEILKRFAKVFDQAYTRFLDLQKAEAQAREAQIEAALERVRSRTTGMQKSEELREVIQTVFEQLQHLDFNIDSAHFNLSYKETDDYNLWSAAPGQPYPVKTHIPYFDHPVFITARQAKEKGLDFFTESYTQDEKNKFFEHLFKHVPVIPEERRKYILSGKGVAASTVLMNTISLWIMNYADIPYSEAENAILKRFGKIFEQSHTRFLDLQKAEAQAKEAIKRASVDRVRAEIASMRTTSDLERITPLIWNELTTLGVPFIRCGVFIMDEEQEQIHTFLSTPDGQAIAAFNTPFANPGTLTEVIPHWRRKELYKAHWDAATFSEQVKILLEQGAIQSPEKYFTQSRPTDLYLHFLPFLQGMLYVGNTAPLSDDELELVQSLADAFSTAYARYEDFNKLESAKEQIEKTLVDLKQAQAQLVQSEKMASLGELTAGIAHEIQNPLNFVNNFSEVSNEMLDEMKTELATGNLQLASEIADDLQQNLEKILHHGKRADAIVKGMLQHSRTSTGAKEPTDINKLADEYLRLSYHGLRAKDKNFNADIKTEFDETIGNVKVIPQDIGRVLLNLYNNAFYAVKPPSPLKGEHYSPTVMVSTKKSNDKIEIRVADNGSGIPQKIVDKIFQPFFTTKPTGQGTGLGLSLSYDIIKAHGGEIKVETKEGEGTTFVIRLPLN